MTCIIAYVEGGKVYMGGDSAGSSEEFTSNRVQPKVFVNGEFCFGYTGSFRLGQIMEHCFDPSDLPKRGEDVMKYMVRKFVPDLKMAFDLNDWPFHDDEKKVLGILVGVRGHLYEIEYDYQVGEWDLPYFAIGSGAPYAMGAMHALHPSILPATDKINLSLEAAKSFDPSVSGPFKIVVT